MTTVIEITDRNRVVSVTDHCNKRLKEVIARLLQG